MVVGVMPSRFSAWVKIEWSFVLRADDVHYPEMETVGSRKVCVLWSELSNPHVDGFVMLGAVRVFDLKEFSSKVGFS